MAETVMTLVLFVALGVFLTFAYVAETAPFGGPRWLVYALLGLVDVILVMLGGSLGLVPVAVGREALVRTYTTGPTALTAPAAELLVDGLPTFGWLCAALGLLGLMLLWLPIRQAAARWLPIDAGRVVHVVALHYGLLAIALAGMTAVFLPIIVAGSGPEGLAQLGGAAVPTLVAQNLGMVVLGCLGVGLFVRRDRRMALERLGLTTRFSWRWWLGATLLGLASAFVVDAAWQALSPESMSQVTRISEMLFKPLLDLGVLGAILAGVLPAVGEETVFRGAAQPRFGLLLTALLFMVIHTQYTISPALAQVLAMGLILGTVRERVNTTTAMAVHATYNGLVFLLGM